MLRRVAAIALACTMGSCAAWCTPKGSVEMRTESECDPVPWLRDYSAIHEPQTFRVAVKRSGDLWVSAEPVRMPMHHATRIQIDNWEQAQGLTGVPDSLATPESTWRVLLRFTSHQIQHVHRDGGDTWNATYRAHVTAVCHDRP